MLNYNNLASDQLDLIDRLYNFDESIIYATMGSGKTVCTLTAISELLRDNHLKRVLVVAPLKPVKEVWACEHLQWEHLKCLNIALAVGDAKKRKAAIESDAPIVVINIENLVWFCDTYKNKHNFDGLVIDELSKFKDNGAKVVKKLRYRTHDFKWKVGLTGSPVHEGYTGLFAQLLVIDGGKAYGTSKQKFLLDYFYPTDYEQRNWEVRDNQLQPLLSRLKNIWYTMPDYTHELPPVNEQPVRFELSNANMAIYKDFAKHSVLEYGGDVIVADNAAVLSGKLEQVTSSFIYDGEDVVELGSLDRQNAFKHLRGTINENCVIFYNFEEEKLQLMEALAGDYMLLEQKGAKDAWNAGTVKNLLLHPKSAGHGLNLQHGGRYVIWYSPIWSNDTFKQAIARLWRRGQTGEVFSIELVCANTVDEIKVQRIEDKQEHDRLLREHFS